MADIFISYKREDRRIAERLSIALEQLGFDVWWDLELLSGDRYRKVIRAVIDQCEVAIVLWSTLAVESDFVLDEASYAKEQNKLCPARIDTVAPPFGFGQVQTDDLSQWDGELSHPGFQALVRSLERRLGRPAKIGTRPPEAQAALEELEAFKAAQTALAPATLEAFLTAYPANAFAPFVRAQLESLRTTVSAASDSAPDLGPTQSDANERREPRSTRTAETPHHTRAATRRKPLWLIPAVGAAVVVASITAALVFSEVQRGEREQAAQETVDRRMRDEAVATQLQRQQDDAARLRLAQLEAAAKQRPAPTERSPGAQRRPGPTLSSPTVRLSWVEVSGAATYRVSITNVTDNSAVLRNLSTAETSRSFSLRRGKAYRWTVAACDAHGCGPHSSRLYFRINAQASVQPRSAPD